MKRLFFILLAVIPFYLDGQSLNDVYNISTSYYQGTAKSMAMGNAMGAVGQDFSSLSINPAGIALYRRPTAVFTPSVITTYAKSDFNNSMVTDSKAKLSINNFGYVWVNKADKLVVNWGIGMNRTNNYNNSIYVNGYNSENSLIDAYFAELNDAGIENEDDLSEYSPSYIYPLWQTYVINFNPLSSPVPIGGLIRQLRGVNSWGGTNEWTISTGLNFDDKIFLGFSLNMPYIYNKRVSDYREEFEINSRPKYWYQQENLSTTGWGVNGKVGIIAYLARWIRIGASFHTPTFYNLEDNWRTYTKSLITIDKEFYSLTHNFIYSVITPYRIDASAAFIFGNYGMITADYEFVDYRNIILSSSYNDYNDYNDAIYDIFSPTSNFRVGTEWRYREFCFRGGYSFYGSPYGFSDTDYRRNALSCGFGYTKHLFTIDFAYIYNRQTHNYYLYSPYTNYVVKNNNGDISPTDVNETTNIHNIVVTLKFKLY